MKVTIACGLFLRRADKACGIELRGSINYLQNLSSFRAEVHIPYTWL
jgi:hypothetical protein